MTNHADANTVHRATYLGADPGAVGAGKLWINNVGSPPYVAKIRNATNTGWDDVVAVGTINPMTTEADIIVGGATGVPERLAVGADGQVLTVDPTTHLLVWADPTGGGMTNPMTTIGDMVVGDTGGAPIALPNGSDGDVLVISLTTHVPEWAGPATSGVMRIGGQATGTGLYFGTNDDNDATIVRNNDPRAVFSYGHTQFADTLQASLIDSNLGYSVATIQVVGAQEAAIAGAASSDAPAQSAAYVQADVQAIATLCNELKAQLNTALAMLRTHGLIAT